MRTSAGYTAIEFLVAVAATMTVLALIFDGFRTYAVRKQVTTGIDAARRWGDVVEARFRSDGRVPRDWNDIGTTLEVHTSSHVKKLQLVDGRLDIHFGRNAAAAIAGHRVSLTPHQTVDEEIVWICGNDAPGLGLHPLGFTNGGTQAVQARATVARRYLPAECR